jgi:hypothetical protein
MVSSSGRRSPPMLAHDRRAVLKKTVVQRVAG